MANNDQNKNGVQNPGTDTIHEGDLIVAKEPWWKTALRIGGYILSAVCGAILGVAISNHMGGDEEDNSSDNSNN